jgi:hypothetical protein
MRTIQGHVVFPGDAPKRKAKHVTIELHDASLEDAPSKMLTQTRLKDVAIEPGGSTAFKIEAPEAARGVAFRVHVDWDGDGKVSAGDLLTTQVIRMPALDETKPVQVPVTLI